MTQPTVENPATETPPGSGLLAGRRAVVTGAAQGIGRAVVESFAREGAHVLAVDRVAMKREELPCGVTATHVCDVADPDAVAHLADVVANECGEVDVVASVAGVLHTGAAHEVDLGHWHRTFRVNTDGIMHLARAFVPHLIARGGGSFTVVGSNAAGVPRAGMAAYAASKAAAAAYTKCLGLDVAHHGIRCNVVAPGSTDTAMQRALWADETGRDAVIAGDLAAHRIGIPLRRLAEPADVADAVTFLASDRARHITMQELYVDGGASLR